MPALLYFAPPRLTSRAVFRQGAIVPDSTGEGLKAGQQPSDLRI